MVMLATSVTATTGVLAVLANAAMAGADMPAVLAGVPESCNHKTNLSDAVFELVALQRARDRLAVLAFC